MDERKRDSIVTYLRRRMAEVGIGVEDIATAIAEDENQVKRVRYRSATGDTWTGVGDMPQWLKQAISAGQSLEHFAAQPTSQSSGPRPSKVNWRDDPFAGSRLATIPQQPTELR